MKLVSLLKNILIRHEKVRVCVFGRVCVCVRGRVCVGGGCVCVSSFIMYDIHLLIFLLICLFNYFFIHLFF